MQKDLLSHMPCLSESGLSYESFTEALASLTHPISQPGTIGMRGEINREVSNVS